MKRLYLIDGTALAYRSHFAFSSSSRGGLSTRDGRPTSATFGFTITLRSLLEREKPDLCAISFDGPKADLERTKIYPEYKSTRAKAPEEMLAQLDDIARIVDAHGLSVAASPGHEADDVIGTLAVQGRDAGYDVYIVTGDKDFMQLVGPHIHLWNLRASTTAPDIIGSDEVVAKFGVEPHQIIDLLALMGDSSDNIPGVPRVGQKTATTLLQTFGSLDAALERFEEVKQPSIRKALQEHRELALLSRRLVTIHTDVPLELKAEDINPPKPDIPALRELFREFEFERLEASLPQDAAVEQDLEQDYRIVRTAEELTAVLTEMRAAGRFAVDTETTSIDPLRADLVGISLCARAGLAYYIPLNLDPPLLGGRQAVIDAVRPLLEDESLGKTGQNIKYDLHVFERSGIHVRGTEFDTMIASYCLSSGIGAHNLDALALRHFGYKKIPTKELLGTGKKQITFDMVDIDVAGRYAAEDADFTWRLREKLEPELETEKVAGVFHDLEIPLIDVLRAMEGEGIRVSLPHLALMSTDLEARIHTIEERIYERAGEPFNLNSPAQIGEVLFAKLEVHRAADVKPRKTKTGQYKTDAAVLQKLAPHHEVPQLILDYRQLAKLKSTYVDSLPLMVHPDTGRIHTSFNQAVAATGRLSSDNPNLQNIPIRTAEGREVRRAFIARDAGWQLLSADYSQIELRILAHVSGDDALCSAFRAGEDIHVRTASLVHGMLPGMVPTELRSQAKAINYGLMYGMGPQRLAGETGMTLKEAKKFIEAYFKVLPKVKAYLDSSLEKARRDGEVWTLFGRRRPLPDIDAKNGMLRVAAENMAVNTPIQGTAADIIKRAMLTLHARLQSSGMSARLLLQVHDELVLDVPDAELDAVTELVREAMEGAADLSVPLVATIGHGATWLDAH